MKRASHFQQRLFSLQSCHTTQHFFGKRQNRESAELHMTIRAIIEPHTSIAKSIGKMHMLVNGPSDGAVDFWYVSVLHDLQNQLSAYMNVLWNTNAKTTGCFVKHKCKQTHGIPWFVHLLSHVELSTYKLDRIYELNMYHISLPIVNIVKKTLQTTKNMRWMSVMIPSKTGTVGPKLASLSGKRLNKCEHIIINSILLCKNKEGV